MTTQTKEASGEVVAWLNTISGETSRSDAYLESMGLTSNIPLVRQSDYLALQEKVKELEAELVSEHGWANHYSKLVVGLTAKLESADIVIKGLRGTIDKQAKESSKLLDRLEAKDAEPCKYCDGTGDVHRADGEWIGECKECTTPPTVHAAIAKKG